MREVFVAVALGAAVAVLSVSGSGCAWLHQTCEAVQPKGDVYLADAALALDEAAAFADILPEPQSTRLVELVQRGRDSLEAARGVIRDACSEDWPATFRDFAAIWTAIRGIVAVVGTGQAALTGHYVHDPLAWKVAR